MSQTDSIWAKLPLKSPPEKFYGFFKNQLGDFVDMFPEYISSIQLVEGENFAPDSVMQFKYSLGGQLLVTNIKIKAVDDEKKVLVYEATEGDALKQYKVFEIRLEAVNGEISKEGGGSFAKSTIVFEKVNENVAAPEDYMEQIVKVSEGIDAYLSKN